MPDSNIEKYLKKLRGDDTDLPYAPQSNVESYLAKMAGQDVELPAEPESRVEALLVDVVESGISGGGGVGVTPSGSVSITANGTHDVAEYAEAVVNVANSYTFADVGKVVNGNPGTGYSLKAQTSATKTGVGGMSTVSYSYVNFKLAALSNAAGASDIAEGKTAYGADGAVITGTASGGGALSFYTATAVFNGTMYFAITMDKNGYAGKFESSDYGKWTKNGLAVSYTATYADTYVGMYTDGVPD